MLKKSAFFLVTLLAVAGPASRSASGLTLHVAADGQAGWSGTLERPNAARTDGPLPSITAARDAIRAARARGEWKIEPVVVLIQPGTYYTSATIEFEAQDGLTGGSTVVYRGGTGGQQLSSPIESRRISDDRPVISGGQPITGWTETQVNGKRAWTTELPEVKAGKWYFRQLFVDGERRPRTRLPKDGYFTFAGLPTTRPETAWGEGQNEAAFKPGDLRNWKNVGDVEVTALSLWIESHLPVAAIDETAHRVKLTKKSVFRLTDTSAPNDFSRYYVENVFEALDTPWQWYLDRPSGKLYYLPKPGERADTITTVAPRLSTLLKITAKPGAQLGLSFENLAFEHVEWSLPPDSAGSPQAAVGVPGAIMLTGASDCRFVNCHVAHVSTYALDFGDGCAHNLVDRCTLTDLGAGGVKLGHGSSHNTVSNCRLGPGGLIHHSAVGVWIGNSGDHLVSHNEIHDLYYTGVSVGWVWGYSESQGARNTIEYNHIHDIGKGMLSDMGGIYTLGVSPGTVLRYNRIHDVAAHSYGGWGIYNDEGSTGMLVENNVVYRTTHGGYHQHYGKENVIRNNIFAFGRDGQVIRSREEEHISFTFERNIVYFSQGALLGSNWGNGYYRIDRNCYWRADGKPFDFAGMSPEAWKAKGRDVHSIIADPQFTDPAGGDFSLSPGSPALQLGFQPIDTRSIGPVK